MNAKLKIILSVVAFGTLPLFIRNIPLTSAEVALFRAVIALICFLFLGNREPDVEKFRVQM